MTSDPVRLTRLRDELRGLRRVVVAFSGGVDSSFLAWVAHDTLGAHGADGADDTDGADAAGGAVAVTARSPSLAADELAHCGELASRWGLRWEEVRTDEMERAAYRRNDADRCFHCKDALMDALAPRAEAIGATVVLGVNLDDLGDHRPGQQAAAARGAAFPLVRAGYTKAAVREDARRLGLSVWDKPAAACLASRVPYGTAVSVGVLGAVERAERGLRRLGFPELRVRHYGELARIEVPLGDLRRVVDRREEVVAAVHGAGYRYVTVDLEGLRSGNLNAALDHGGLVGKGPVSDIRTAGAASATSGSARRSSSRTAAAGVASPPSGAVRG